MTFAEHIRPVLDRKLPAALVAAAVMLCSPVRAEDHPAPGAAPDCQLHRLASLPITTLADGQLGVPVTLQGKEQILTLGISDPYSYLYTSYVKAAGLPLKNMPAGVEIQMGKARVKLLAIVSDIEIGVISGKYAEFAAYDDAAGGSGPEVGELALDVLSHFDVDLDFAQNRLNLFSKDHCAGHVVYWSDSYASVPFDTDSSGHPSVRMELDGKPLTVAFAITPGPGRMAMATVKRLFGIDETAPGMKSIATDSSGGPANYRYPFQRLTIEGVAVEHPVIDLDPKAHECRSQPHFSPDGMEYCFGGSELELGLEELRRLHLYFAFKEKKLYVTAASTDSAKGSPSATGAPTKLGNPK